jgi:hypothetical protein
MGLLAWAATARAQTTASAHYTLEPAALDAGGLTGASAGNRCTLNSSAMSGGPGFSSHYACLTGYAGQLREPVSAIPVVVGIALRASPATIAEDGTRQIQADLCHADGTWTPLSGNLVSWSVQSGPIGSVTSTGIATGSPVYRDTPATVRGQYQGLSASIQLIVLDTLNDNFGSYAGDGLPDDWQVTYFGLNNPNAAPNADPDTDGYNNRFEYDACLEPLDRFSTFRIFFTTDRHGRRTVAFYPFYDGCSYTLQGSNDLVNWSPALGTVSDQGNFRTILPSAPFLDRQFYRIDVRRQ